MTHKIPFAFQTVYECSASSLFGNRSHCGDDKNTQTGGKNDLITTLIILDVVGFIMFRSLNAHYSLQPINNPIDYIYL